MSHPGTSGRLSSPQSKTSKQNMNPVDRVEKRAVSPNDQLNVSFYPEMRSVTMYSMSNPDNSDLKIYDNPNNINNYNNDLRSATLYSGTHSGIAPLSHVGPPDDSFDEESHLNNFENLKSASQHPNDADEYDKNAKSLMPTKKSSSYVASRSSDSGCFSWKCCWTLLCLLILLILLALALFYFLGDNSPLSRSIGGGTNAPTTSPTMMPSLSPTTTPTLSPVAPTASPTQNPTLSPTTSPTKSPTKSPTHFPTTSPTQSPTTTFDHISSICAGSTGEIRTSMCLNTKNWVMCEKDGTVIMTNQAQGQYIRTCDSTDACPCSTLKRVFISDPCVLASDVNSSNQTCSADA